MNVTAGIDLTIDASNGLHLTNDNWMSMKDSTEATVDFKSLQEFYEKHKYDVPTVVTVTACVQAIIVMIGIVANFIVICVTILGNTNQESSSIIYVTNLSISNFVFLIVIPFKLMENVLLQWTLGDGLCQIITFIKHLNFSVVALFLMVMSIDRYLAVNRALSASHLRSKRISMFTCLFVWSLSLAGALPLAVHSNAGGAKCDARFPGPQVNISVLLNSDMEKIAESTGEVCKYHSKSAIYSVWTICNFFYSFFIPFLVIVCCYCAIVRRVRHPSGVVNAKGRLNRIIKRKVTRMAMILVTSYAVCYTPYYVWQVYKLIGIPVSHSSVCAHVHRFNTTMAYVNSALHPIVYGCTSGQFRLQFEQAKKKVTCKRQGGNPNTRYFDFSRKRNVTTSLITVNHTNVIKVDSN